MKIPQKKIDAPAAQVTLSPNPDKMTSSMSNFKEAVLNFKTVIHSSQPMPDPKHLGLHVMTQLIPKMEATGDVAFAWHWKGNDVCVYNPAEYAEETGMYRKKGLKMDKGDTTWFYDYTYKGNKRRCILTTEIWYNNTERFRTSPFAFLFRQYMAEGLHITKVRFVNQPQADEMPPLCVAECGSDGCAKHGH